MSKKQILNIDAEFEGVEFDEAKINRGTANRIKVNDPQYIENHKKGIAKRSENPNWLPNQIAKNKRLFQTEEWQKASAEANRLKAMNPEWQASQKNGCEEYWKNTKNKHAGSKNPNYKGMIVGTNIATGEVIKFIGLKELNAAGFSHSKVYICIAGKRPSHKGYTWRREE